MEKTGTAGGVEGKLKLRGPRLRGPFSIPRPALFTEDPPPLGAAVRLDRNILRTL